MPRVLDNLLKVRRRVEKVEREDEEKNSEDRPSKKRQIVDFNKPFSYYYQVLERKKLEEMEKE